MHDFSAQIPEKTGRTALSFVHGVYTHTSLATACKTLFSISISARKTISLKLIADLGGLQHQIMHVGITDKRFQ